MWAHISRHWAPTSGILPLNVVTHISPLNEDLERLPTPFLMLYAVINQDFILREYYMVWSSSNILLELDICRRRGRKYVEGYKTMAKMAYPITSKLRDDYRLICACFRMKCWILTYIWMLEDICCFNTCVVVYFQIVSHFILGMISGTAQIHSKLTRHVYSWEYCVSTPVVNNVPLYIHLNVMRSCSFLCTMYQFLHSQLLNMFSNIEFVPVIVTHCETKLCPWPVIPVVHEQCYILNGALPFIKGNTIVYWKSGGSNLFCICMSVNMFFRYYTNLHLKKVRVWL